MPYNNLNRTSYIRTYAYLQSLRREYRTARTVRDQRAIALGINVYARRLALMRRRNQYRPTRDRNRRQPPYRSLR